MKKLFIIMLLTVAAQTINAQKSHSIYFWNKGTVVDSLLVDSITFSPAIFEKDTTVAYVDLGLSVKWATCNLGAASPEEVGGYYAWGETSPKTSFGEPTYKWNFYYGKTHAKTKYTTLRSENTWGAIDNKTELEAGDDAATVTLGNPWRMPTQKEIKELLDSCTWKNSTINGVSGKTVTGKNGKSIFIPNAGYYDGNDTGASFINDRDCHYWSKSRKSNEYAVCFRITPLVDSIERSSGLPIRPVRP